LSGYHGLTVTNCVTEAFSVSRSMLASADKDLFVFAVIVMIPSGGDAVILVVFLD